jgi:hypothetical protein
MDEQQLKELRAMESKINVAEEKARSSRVTVEELKVSSLLLIACTDRWSVKRTVWC